MSKPQRSSFCGGMNFDPAKVPVSKFLRELWLKELKLTFSDDPNLFPCSKHFQPEDIIGKTKNVTLVKRSSIPI